jgi:hypothetical protein
VLLQPIRWSGTATPAEQKLLEDRVLATVELLLSERGDELVHREEIEAELQAHPELKGCTEARCLLRLGDRFSAERVVTIAVERSGSGKKPDWNVRVDQFLVAPAHGEPTTELPCKACTADAVVGDLSHILDPLLTPKPEEAVCTVIVTAKPGSVVKVDGVEMGTAPFHHTLGTQHREVTVEGKTRSLECMAGADLQLEMGLPEAPSPAPVRRRVPVLKIVGGALLVLGVAGLIAGGVDLARDGNGTCDKAAGQRRCPQVYDTSGAGAALTGLGVAAVVGGVAVFTVDALRKPRAYVSIGKDQVLLTIGGAL